MDFPWCDAPVAHPNVKLACNAARVVGIASMAAVKLNMARAGPLDDGRQQVLFGSRRKRHYTACVYRAIPLGHFESVGRAGQNPSLDYYEWTNTFQKGTKECHLSKAYTIRIYYL